MNRAARSVLRKIGTDLNLEAEQEQRLGQEAQDAQSRIEDLRKRGSGQLDSEGLGQVPDEMLSESEKRHQNYRRQQASAGRFAPAAERLPIMTTDERKERDKNRPKWQGTTSFEGPIEKLIEKYDRDLDEVQRHLTLGQSMKYEFTDDGKVLDTEGNVIFDGENVVQKK